MFKEVSLELAEKEKITGLRCGTGSLPCLVVGAGSFYLQMLSENLKKEFVFFCFDDLWVFNPRERIDNDVIKSQSFISLSKQIQRIVYALQKEFEYTKIGLMGFSAPGLLAFTAATELGSKNIAFVIGSGIASTKLDQNFKANDIYFEKHADTKRLNQLKKDEEEFTLLTANLNKIEPRLLWLLELRKIKTKQLDDYENSEFVTKFCKLWGETPDGKIINETMRRHFFELLQSQNPETIFNNFMETGIPVMLSYGQHDFTTPPPPKVIREKWQSSVSFFKYPGSVHYPYFENRSQDKFDSDLIHFTRNVLNETSSNLHNFSQ